MSKISLNSIPHRYTPSPSRLSYLATSRIQNAKSPEYPPIYPSWLVQRNDFQEIFKEYDSLEKIDLVPIFQKESSQRKDSEVDAIDLFIQSSFFFGNIFNARSLLRKFFCESYNDGESLFNPEAKTVNIILKGTVLLDNQLIITKYNAVGEFQIIENRNIPAIAHGPVNAILITEDLYRTLFMHNRIKQLKQATQVLKSLPIFEEVRVLRLEKIAMSAISLQYEKDEVVYSIGNEADYFFIVLSGKVELSSQIKLRSVNDLPIGFKKREKLIVEQNFYTPIISVSANEHFGLSDAVVQSKRKTIAKTSQPSVVFAFKWSEVLEILTEQERELVKEKISEKFNNKSLSSMLRSKLTSHRRHITALMEASDVKKLPSGRETFEEFSKRKRAYAKVLTNKEDQLLKENLVSKSYTFRDIILPKIKCIYNN
jgi:CRP-like cAMP-binding protein